MLNMSIPIVTRIPINNFYLPNFNSLSLTLEQKIPTKITDKTLQDLTITTAGNDA
jgi:hypothetical protein